MQAPARQSNQREHEYLPSTRGRRREREGESLSRGSQRTYRQHRYWRPHDAERVALSRHVHLELGCIASAPSAQLIVHLTPSERRSGPAHAPSCGPLRSPSPHAAAAHAPGWATSEAPPRPPAVALRGAVRRCAAPCGAGAAPRRRYACRAAAFAVLAAAAAAAAAAAFLAAAALAQPWQQQPWQQLLLQQQQQQPAPARGPPPGASLGSLGRQCQWQPPWPHNSASDRPCSALTSCPARSQSSRQQARTRRARCGRRSRSRRQGCRSQRSRGQAGQRRTAGRAQVARGAGRRSRRVKALVLVCSGSGAGRVGAVPGGRGLGAGARWAVPSWPTSPRARARARSRARV